MSCEAIQNQLLRCEDPFRTPPELVRHLTGCAACRAFRERLVELEEGVRQLPVPVSTGRARLLARLEEGELPTPSPSGIRPSVWRPTPKERAHQKLALALTLAASLALFALGWAFWPHGTSETTRMRADVATNLARVTTPTARAQIIMTAARQAEADVLKAIKRRVNADVDDLAAYYVELVEEELPKRVRDLPDGERAAVVAGLVEQLERSESTLARSAAAMASPRAELARMAQAARAGQDRLRALVG